MLVITERRRASESSFRGVCIMATDHHCGTILFSTTHKPRVGWLVTDNQSPESLVLRQGPVLP